MRPTTKGAGGTRSRDAKHRYVREARKEVDKTNCERGRRRGRKGNNDASLEIL